MGCAVILSGGVLLPTDDPRTRELRELASMANPAAAKHSQLVAKGRIHPYAPRPPARVSAWVAIPGAGDGRWARGATVYPRALPGVEVEQDIRTAGPTIEPIRLGPSLRPYQHEAIEAALKAPGEHGVIVAPCGAGKTQIGIAIAARLGLRTLVLVHTLDLAEQWRTRVSDVCGVRAGLVGDGVVDDAPEIPVVVATMQTLATWEWARRQAWGRGFGLVLVDEAHHSPCATLIEVLSSMPARWRFGLTATPDREDGLTPILHWLCGPVAHRITHAELDRAGAILIPELRRVQTGWEPDDVDAPWATTISDLTMEPDREALLDREIQSLLADGRRVLVLSDRVEHCRSIASRHGGEALVGAVSAKRRLAILAAAREGTLRLVTGTAVADEGLDVPGLDAVVLSTPSRALGRVEQRIGRVMRPEPDKRRPVVVDLVDAWGPLRHQARLRMDAYRRLGIT